MSETAHRRAIYVGCPSRSPDILDNPSWRMWRLLLGISSPSADEAQIFWWTMEYNWLRLAGNVAANPWPEKIPYTSKYV